MVRSWSELKKEDLHIPVIVDTGTGNPDIVVGDGELKDGVLSIEFGKTFAAEAIQRALSRGELLALAFFKPDLSEESAETTEVEPTNEESNDE